MVVKDVKVEKGFRKLMVWQKAHQWVLLIYKLTEKIPKHEVLGSVSQMRRAAVSVAANMAEDMQPGEKVNLEGMSTLHKVHWLKSSTISFLHLISNTFTLPRQSTSKPNHFDLKQVTCFID